MSKTGQDRVDYLRMGLATLEHMAKCMKLLEVPHEHAEHNKINDILSDNNSSPNETLYILPRSVIEGPWGDVLQIVIPHLQHFETFSYKFRYSAEYKTKSFIANILCFPSMCPNPYIRLEMIGLICNLEFLHKYNHYEKGKLAEGFVTTMADISIDVIEIHLDNYLSCSIDNIQDLIDMLYDSGYLHDIGDKILLQLEQNSPGKEVYFFANLFNLIGRLSLYTSKESKENQFTKLVIVKVGISLLYDLNKLFDRDFAKFRKACQHHILLPHITNSIAEITYSIITLHSQILLFEGKLKFLHSLFLSKTDCIKLLVCAINDRDFLVEKLNLPTSTNKLASMQLQWQHGGYHPEFNHKFMSVVATSVKCEKYYINASKNELCYL
ncbi:unnamed protein product [Meganyctiphanes norvegica]|uniref:Uncharacterized protein n=1 Tax=Meganyctiphanes norvegica TaxID=48144 RepID=A0AAV2QZH9_MEGNR